MRNPTSSSPVRVIASVVVAGFLLLGVTAGYFWYTWIGPGRYLEVEHFKEQLSAIPGVNHVEVHGHEDVGYEIHGFTLEIEGHGTLELGGLSDPASESLEKLHINRIGDHRVTYAVEGFLGTYESKTREPTRTQGWGNGFTVGTRGAHAHLFPFPIRSVADVVERYDDICEVLSDWPVQPDYAKLVDSEGVRWFYALTDPALGDAWLRPAELEGPE